MKEKHIGSSFEDFLKENNIYDEVVLSAMENIHIIQAKRIKELKEALKPFVEWYKIRKTQRGLTGNDKHSDDTPIFMATSVDGEVIITLGDLRKAMKAFNNDE